MEAIVIYGSKYGTTKRYAQKFSEITGIKAAPYTKAGNLSSYGTILYFGGLYAGGVLGLAKTVGGITPEQSLMIITVGLADPEDAVNARNIKNSISKQISAELYSSARIYHLRGGIDYKKLTFMHKIMMKMVYENDKKIPLEEQTPDAKEMIATYNKEVDFVNYDTLREIVKAVS